MREPKRIGIWQTAFLGDAVLTLPLTQALAARFPEAELHLFVRAGVDALFRHQRELASVRGFAKRGAQKSLRAAWGYGRELSHEGFDLWISAHTSARSALIAAATGIPRRIGYAAPWFNRLAYTETVGRDFERLEEIERLMRLAEPLGIGLPAPKPRLDLDPAARAAAESFRRDHIGRRKVLGLHPGSTWATKCWPVEYFSRIVELAAAQGVCSVVFAGPGEEDVAAAVIGGARVEARVVVSLAGKLSLPALAAHLSVLDAYLTNDSGPMHLAWVQDVPLVAVFGPTVRELGFFPRGEGSTVLEHDLACRPCGLHGHRACPDGHHDCMRAIAPESAWAVLREKLGV